MNRKHPQQGPTNLQEQAHSPPPLLCWPLPPPTLLLPLARSLSLPLPSQKEDSELTKCQLTLNVCPSHLPLWTADSSGVWVNTKGLQRIIILLLAPPPPPPLPPPSLPLLSFYFVSNGVVLQFNAQSKGDIKWLSKEFHLGRRGAMLHWDSQGHDKG